jgi:DHA2 family multidrug resistance protein
MRRGGSGGHADERPLSETLTTGTRIIITLAVLSATLMEVLDTSIVNVALPHMQGELGATLDEIGWVATGYIISNVIVLPLTGWLSDAFGRRRYLTWSVILFTVSSFGCGISRQLDLLIVMRVLQGIGGAAFLSTAQATLIEIFPSSQQGLAQAMFGIGVVMAPTLGPTLGGFLTDRYSWPYIFFINIPVGIIAAILTWLYVPDSKAANVAGRADFIGIGFLAVGLGCMQGVLERGQRKDWFQSELITWLTIASVVGLILFLWWEMRPANRNPAVNLRVLKNRNLLAGCFCAGALGFVLYGTVFALPQFLQNLQDHSAEQTGVLLIPSGLASAVTMVFVGQMLRRLDPRYLIGVGIVVTAGSLLMFAHRFTYETPDSALFWPLVLRGAGLGLQFVPLSLASLGTLPPRQVAQGSGLYNLCRQLGGSFGIAVLATILDRRTQFHYARLHSAVAPGNVLVQNQLATLERFAAMHGISGPGAQAAANRMLYGTVLREAALGGYIDLFWLGGCVGLAMLFFLLLFKRPRITQQPMH